MKALTLDHPDLTRAKLLALAETIPGAWLGLKVAAFLLLLAGWKPTAVTELFGLRGFPETLATLTYSFQVL